MQSGCWTTSVMPSDGFRTGILICDPVDVVGPLLLCLAVVWVQHRNPDL